MSENTNANANTKPNTSSNSPGKRILIVGGVAGGASVAARCRRLDESSEIIVFERGPHPSYSNCCLPNHLSGEIPHAEDLLLMSPAQFKALHNIDVRVRQEVTAIDPTTQTITVRKLEDGTEYQESYDELVLATGASPILPRSIEGIGQEHVFSVRDVPDVQAIASFLEARENPRIVVVGGGFIGLEVAENLKQVYEHVTIVEGQDQVLPTLDEDMAKTVHRILYDHDIELILGDAVQRIGERDLELSSGRKLPADVVIMAIGVRPNTELAEASGIELGEQGGIRVDRNYRTNLPHIYAVGDVIDTHHLLTQKPTRLTLAGPAQRQARACANAIYGLPTPNKGVVGSSVLRLFDYTVASTGLTERQCEAEGISHQVSYVMPFDKVSLMEGARPLFFKLIFHDPSGDILGAQAIGQGDVAKRVDVVSTLIQLHGNLSDLQELELCYAPPYSTAKDVTNLAAYVGQNILQGVYEQVRMSEVRRLVEEGAYFLDVRPAPAYEAAHIRGARNIPLAQLRDRLSELPRDQTIYLSCRTSHTSYYATRVLQLHGFTNVKNVMGSMLGLSNYFYFDDQTTGRESALTGYVFD